ncbi:multiheme c-type cytochrome [Pedobacter jamesrossensis]|uniref:Multiheme c-type cytochrome n=1 Tax=Pedobacter jamesrossensis TaxID=1908238 RepID=A0ABV8NE19_9SPHI
MNTADKIPSDARGINYTGAATCIKCHTDIGKSFVHNAHGLSSSMVANKDVSKCLETDSNSFAFDANMKVKIEKRDSGIYQVAYINGKQTRAQRFDVAFGSGEKAFTYAYWKGKKLFQLPLSHFSAIKTWANSPGFPIKVMYFDRPITSRCLECHSSFVKTEKKQVAALAMDEEMEKGSLIYGIDCERCHGPGKQHAVFHLENPEEKTAKFITIFETLTRKQKMDACGVCHSGNTLTTIQSVFNFQPGDDLDSFYAQDFVSFGGANPDVHGNQTAMLKGSMCYRKSEMTCQSCHNSHETVKGNMAIYSQRCISCHQNQKHTELTLAKGVLKTNCIDCHMPMQASKLISFQTAGNKNVNPYLLRSHHIGVYPGK